MKIRHLVGVWHIMNTQQRAPVTSHLLIRNPEAHPLRILVLCATWGQAHLWGSELTDAQIFSLWFSDALEPSGASLPQLCSRSPQGWVLLEERCLQGLCPGFDNAQSQDRHPATLTYEGESRSPLDR